MRIDTTYSKAIVDPRFGSSESFAGERLPQCFQNDRPKISMAGMGTGSQYLFEHEWPGKLTDRRTSLLPALGSANRMLSACMSL